MTTIHNLPIEICKKMIDYCNNKSIINLGKVDCFFYNVTKEHREKIKNLLEDYPTYSTEYDKNNYIMSCILTGKILQLNILLQLGILHPNDNIYTIRQFQYSREAQTSIDWAVDTYDLNIIKLFMEYGCNLNKQNKLGYTPLMICIINLQSTDENQLMILDYLLKNKANPNIESNNGYIAMDFVNNFDPFVCDILRDHGSREGNLMLSEYVHSCNCSNCSWEYDIDNDSENYDESGDYDYDSDEEMGE